MIEPSRTWEQKVGLAITIMVAIFLTAKYIAYVANAPSESEKRERQEIVARQAELTTRLAESEKALAEQRAATEAGGDRNGEFLEALKSLKDQNKALMATLESDRRKNAEIIANQKSLESRIAGQNAALVASRQREQQNNAELQRLQVRQEAARSNPPTPRWNPSSPRFGTSRVPLGSNPGRQAPARRPYDSGGYRYYCVGNNTNWPIRFDAIQNGYKVEHTIPPHAYAAHIMGRPDENPSTVTLRFYDGRSYDYRSVRTFIKQTRPRNVDCRGLESHFVADFDGIISLR